jgi:hypothetical protein
MLNWFERIQPSVFIEGSNMCTLAIRAIKKEISKIIVLFIQFDKYCFKGFLT